MKLLRNIYLLIIIFIRNGSFNQDVNSLDRKELEYLSFRLNPLECIQLVNTMTVSMKYSTKKRIKRILGRYFDSDVITRQDCLIKLENWNNNFLGANTNLIIVITIYRLFSLNLIRLLIYLKKGEKDSNIRETMDVTLRMLGRPDLAAYLLRDRRNKSLDSININTNADALEGQWHPIFKRNPYKRSEEIFFREGTANNKNNNNCTNQTREIHHSVNPDKEKAVLQKKQPNKLKHDQELTNANERSKTMDWLNILILLSLFFIVTCALALCITRRRKRNKILSARSNNSYNCTCNCSDVHDLESRSMKDYLKYHRSRKNDDESRMLLKRKRKERTKDRDLVESYMKKNLKAKKQRKQHKSKRKPLRSKEFDKIKLHKHKIRSSIAKNYPICECCHCIAEYK